MKKYKLNEIFFSIQGEGFWTGSAVLFVRFAGCNLSCPWCDTDHSLKFELNENDLIIKIIQMYPDIGGRKRIVLTGGEPSLQLDIENNGSCEFIRKLRDLGFYVAIETNGTHILPNNLDWTTVSPKQGNFKIEKGNELKIINDGLNGIVLDAIFEDTSFDHYFIQPCEYQKEGGHPDIKKNIENTQKTIHLVLRNPEWRLSIQIQKEIHIR